MGTNEYRDVPYWIQNWGDEELTQSSVGPIPAKGEAMKAVFSNSIFMAAGLTACADDDSTLDDLRVTKSIFGPDEDDSRLHHSTTVTVGGNGKLSLPLQPIAVRSVDQSSSTTVSLVMTEATARTL